MRDVRRWLRAQWDRVLGALSMAAGGLAIVLGWWGVSGTTKTSHQLPYLISGGLGGLFLLGVGATLWLSADLRDEWRHLASMEDRIVERLRSEHAESDRSVDPSLRLVEDDCESA